MKNQLKMDFTRNSFLVKSILNWFLIINLKMIWFKIHFQGFFKGIINWVFGFIGFKGGGGVFSLCPPPSNQETIFKLFKWFVQWNHLVLPIHYFIGPLHPPPQTINHF